MANGLNKCTLIGNLGRDPELKYTPGGLVVCNFSIATTETYKDKNGEKVNKVEWHRVVCFGKLAEICGEYLSKGKQVYLEGKIQTRSYEKDGNKIYTTEIIANNMIMLGGNQTQSKPNTKPNNQTQSVRQFNEGMFPAPNQYESDDIPF